MVAGLMGEVVYDRRTAFWQRNIPDLTAYDFLTNFVLRPIVPSPNRDAAEQARREWDATMRTIIWEEMEERTASREARRLARRAEGTGGDASTEQEGEIDGSIVSFSTVRF